MKLKEEIVKLCQSGQIEKNIDELILGSPAYTELRHKIDNGTCIDENSDLWDQLEKSILKVSPAFHSNLYLLTGGKLTKTELHTAILIKCGITPSQMTVAFSKTKGTISSRRDKMCMKIFDQKLALKEFDEIIRAL